MIIEQRRDSDVVRRLQYELHQEYLEKYGKADLDYVSGIHVNEGTYHVLVEFAAWDARGMIALLQVGDIAFSGHLYVREGFRKHGIAEQLVETQEELARVLQVKEIRLETEEDVVIRMREGRGFTDIEPFGTYRDNPGSRFLAKTLGETA